VETQLAAISDEERCRPAVQTPADSIESVEGEWAVCSAWNPSECWLTYQLFQRGVRVCGYYEYWAGDRQYEGQLAGRRITNQIEIEFTCGRPGSDAKNWCPEDEVPETRGWGSAAQSLAVCAGRLFPDAQGCSSEKLGGGLKRASRFSELKTDSADRAWLARCLADDRFPPAELMAPE
jgi:hypothetical protein